MRMNISYGTSQKNSTSTAASQFHRTIFKAMPRSSDSPKMSVSTLTVNMELIEKINAYHDDYSTYFVSSYLENNIKDRHELQKYKSPT